MPNIIRLTDFVAETTNWIAEKIVAAQVDPTGIFRLSLCGGGTPRPIYAALAAREDIDWTRVLITFGDERAVAPDSDQSNYRMAKETLLDAANVPAANVMRIAGELDAEEAASRCDQQLSKLALLAGEPIFVHDLVLLGMGDDGHTASLFPDTKALAETEKTVVSNFVDKFDSWRITFTYPLIDAAKEIAFLVNGEAKHPMAETVLAGNPDLPASIITEKAGDRVTWLIG